MDPVSPWSLELIRALQSLGSWLAAPMHFASALGAEEFYLLALPFVFWCISRDLGIDLVALVLASGGLNWFVKGLFKLPRPFWVDSRLGLSTEPTFGFPSGHSQNAVALFGYLAAVLRSPWRWLSVLLIFLISVSRLYLGVHSPLDILGGWLIGLIVLGGFIWLKPRLGPVMGRWSLRKHVLAALIVSAIMLVLYLLAGAIANGQPVVYGALFATAHVQIYESAGTEVGVILGAWIGLAVEARFVRFSPSGSLGQRALRLVIGVLVVVGLRFGLKAIFPTEPVALSMAFRVVRYAVIMAWVALIWPWLFVRLGLAQREAVR